MKGFVTRLLIVGAFAAAAVGTSATDGQAGGRPLTGLKPGLPGTTFRLDNGLQIRLVSYRQEHNIRTFPGGPIWKPRKGDVVISTTWLLRNGGSRSLGLDRFLALSRGVVKEGRVVGNAAYADRLGAHQSEELLWFFEIRKEGARVYYGPDQSIQHAKAIWIIKR